MSLYFVMVVIVLLIDRITKLWVVSKMELSETIPVINGFFHITYIKNSGAAFGILANMRWGFVIVTVLVLTAIFYMAVKTSREDRYLTMIYGMITGGALGNLIDRVRTGLVIDFFDFRGIWPYIFNVADSFVVVGVILLTWQIFRTEKIL
jgi:signal peptidase II